MIVDSGGDFRVTPVADSALRFQVELLGRLIGVTPVADARLRFQEDDKSPHLASAKSAETREKLTAEVLDLVKDDEETHGSLAAAIKSAALFFGYR